MTLIKPYRPVGSNDERAEGSVPSAEPPSQDRSQESATSLSRSEPSVQGSALHETPRIRVLLVDDHAMVRQGLRSILESYHDIEVVGEAADGTQSLVSVEQERPSVVVMDLNMPKMNGIEATAIIKSRYPEIVVLGLSVNAGDDNQTAMRQAGAAGLLTKEAAVDQLHDLIHQALAAGR